MNIERVQEVHNLPLQLYLYGSVVCLTAFALTSSLVLFGSRGRRRSSCKLSEQLDAVESSSFAGIPRFVFGCSEFYQGILCLQRLNREQLLDYEVDNCSIAESGLHNKGEKRVFGSPAS